MKPLAVIILAAGKGTRMKSELPKALHPLCGEPMLGALLESAKALSPDKIIVVAGHQYSRVRHYLDGKAAVIRQRQLLGSGHAVNQAAKALSGFKGAVVVLYCDTPLISARTLKSLVKRHAARSAVCTLLTVVLQNPSGYGRIRRTRRGLVEKIVEENDASGAEKKIREINVGCYVFNSKALFGALQSVRKNPKKKEYYLTDAIEILSRQGNVEPVATKDTEEVLGINTLQDLAALEGIMQKKILDQWSQRGVRIRDPRTTTIDANVQIGVGTVILPSTVIEAGSVIGKACSIGPFARIRGGSRIGNGAIIGNFVEIVRSKIGDKTQIKHLSYIGDTQVGSGVNIGAGTITANFDGKKKHKTIIKDRAEIGSGTVLVAPVTVGRAAKTGAGAVVTKGKNVPDHAVVVGIPAKKLGKTR